jgi:6-phosphogluconate dehydrogenase
MQLIAETYDIMRRALGMSAAEIGKVFDRWNNGKLESFLVELTGQVLQVTDSGHKAGALIDQILDTAEQKGTGRWTSQNALDLATPIPTIDAAVGARIMSSRKEERVAASLKLTGPTIEPVTSEKERAALIDHLENALYFAKISSYAQGMALLQAASTTYNWNLNLSEIARVWMAGCIIRAELLDPIRAAFKDDPELVNLLLAPHITKDINESSPSARIAIETAVRNGIPVPAYTASLNYVDTYRTDKLPANLIQGLRDDFGAHTYRRLDTPGIFHTIWATGETTTIG